jgi:hypothetical protein
METNILTQNQTTTERNGVSPGDSIQSEKTKTKTAMSTPEKNEIEAQAFEVLYNLKRIQSNKESLEREIIEKINTENGWHIELFKNYLGNWKQSNKLNIETENYQKIWSFLNANDCFSPKLRETDLNKFHIPTSFDFAGIDKFIDNYIRKKIQDLIEFYKNVYGCKERADFESKSKFFEQYAFASKEENKKIAEIVFDYLLDNQLIKNKNGEYWFEFLDFELLRLLPIILKPYLDFLLIDDEIKTKPNQLKINGKDDFNRFFNSFTFSDFANNFLSENDKKILFQKEFKDLLFDYLISIELITIDNQGGDYYIISKDSIEKILKKNGQSEPGQSELVKEPKSIPFGGEITPIIFSKNDWDKLYSNLSDKININFGERILNGLFPNQEKRGKHYFVRFKDQTRTTQESIFCTQKGVWGLKWFSGAYDNGKDFITVLEIYQIHTGLNRKQAIRQLCQNYGIDDFNEVGIKPVEPIKAKPIERKKIDVGAEKRKNQYIISQLKSDSLSAKQHLETGRGLANIPNNFYFLNEFDGETAIAFLDSEKSMINLRAFNTDTFESSVFANNGKKTKNLGSFSNCIYDCTYKPDNQTVYLVEGVYNAFALWLNGCSVLATFSTSNHLSNVEKFKPYFEGKRVVLAFDNDTNPQKSGQKYTDKIGLFISEHCAPKSIEVLNFSPGLDANDLHKQNELSKFLVKFDNYTNWIAPQQPLKPQTNTNAFEVVENKEYKALRAPTEFLKSRYEFRKNTILGQIESRAIGRNEWQKMNFDEIYISLKDNYISIKKGDLESLLNTSFVPKFNPIQSYFDGLPEWFGNQDYISELASFITTDNQDFFTTQFKKMLVRCVACALNPKYVNRTVFVLVGNQELGKSQFFRFLNPLGGDYYKEDMLRPENKDCAIALSNTFIWNLEELDGISNKNLESLKAFISQNNIRERKPWATDETPAERIVNFFGSTNKDEFLRDETGNSRWLCFRVQNIDWSYNNTQTGFKKIDIHKVWAQAYALYKNDFDFELTASEKKERDEINKTFETPSPEKDLILKYLRPANNQTPHIKKGTATDISLLLADYEQNKIKLNPVIVGKTLKSLGFESKKSNGSLLYLYEEIG